MKKRSYVDPSDISGVIASMQSTENGITAAVASDQADGYPVTTQISRITTCANAGDSLTLPAATAGDTRFVINSGANSADIFPAVGDQINALGADAAFALAAGKGVMFVCAVDGTWNTLLTA